MKAKTVSVSKKEYQELKKKAKLYDKNVDWEEVKKFKESFEDIKHGRITEWKPKTK